MEALKDVNFSVEQSEYVAINGGNLVQEKVHYLNNF